MPPNNRKRQAIFIRLARSGPGAVAGAMSAPARRRCGPGSARPESAPTAVRGRGRAARGQGRQRRSCGDSAGAAARGGRPGGRGSGTGGRRGAGVGERCSSGTVTVAGFGRRGGTARWRHRHGGARGAAATSREGRAAGIGDGISAPGGAATGSAPGGGGGARAAASAGRAARGRHGARRRRAVAVRRAVRRRAAASGAGHPIECKLTNRQGSKALGTNSQTRTFPLESEQLMETTVQKIDPTCTAQEVIFILRRQLFHLIDHL
jgi:hypothetical protein